MVYKSFSVSNVGSGLLRQTVHVGTFIYRYYISRVVTIIVILTYDLSSD